MRFRRHKIRGLIDKIDPTFLEMNTQSLVIMRHFRVTLSVVVYLEDLYGGKGDTKCTIITLTCLEIFLKILIGD